MKWIAGYAASVCILLIIVAQSIFIPTFHMVSFFSWHYERYNVPETIGIDKEELMYVTAQLLDYMRGRRDDLVVYATVNGELQTFFSDRDIRHMEDVLELYNTAFLVRNIAFWLLLFLIFGMMLFKAPVLEVLARCSREVLVTFILLLGVLAGVIALDWDQAFIIFHEIFFDNDYWILTPGADPLIDMVNHPFFLNISIITGSLLVLFSAIIIISGTLYLRSVRPWGDTQTVARFR